MGTIGIDMILRQLIKQLSFLLIVISFHVGYVSAEVEWYSVGPGGGGWIQSLACGLRKNTVYLGGDVSGFYTSETTGNDWKPQNANLQDYYKTNEGASVIIHVFNNIFLLKKYI